MSYHIAFDVAHKPRGQINENLTELRDHLTSNDFACYNFLEIPITEDKLTPYDILVFVCPDFSRVSSSEITEISNWVKNSGGGLLFLSHAGGDRGRGSNLSEISENFGILFESDQVLDERINLGLENIPLVSTFNVPHPITTNVGTLCYRSGCSLSIVGTGVFSIADSNETSEPFSCPLICVAESGKGRVCCIGSYEMFRDKVAGGFQCEDHPDLALNMFKWLVSDYRIELRSSIDVPVPIDQPSGIAPQIIEGSQQSASPTQIENKSIKIDFSMQISKKSELVELLKIFQNQINTIKTTIDNLIKSAIESKDVIVEMPVKKALDQSIDTLVDQPLEEPLRKPIRLPELDKKKPIRLPEPEIEKPVEKEVLKDDSELTALPPKPESLIVEAPEDSELPAASKHKTEGKTKKDLKDEKQGLESKLSSVEDLQKYIDKKHTSGKINDEEYSKRSKKIQKDIKKTNKRLSVINKLLDK